MSFKATGLNLGVNTLTRPRNSSLTGLCGTSQSGSSAVFVRLPHCESFLKEDPRPQRLCADAERKRTRNEESSESIGGHAQLAAGLGAFFGDPGLRVFLTAHR